MPPEKFGPGYITTVEKDTIQGFIMEKTDAELAEKFSFKHDINSVLKTYVADELLMFGFDHGRNLLVRKYPYQNNPDLFLSDNSQTLAFPNSRKRRLLDGEFDHGAYPHIK